MLRRIVPGLTVGAVIAGSAWLLPAPVEAGFGSGWAQSDRLAIASPSPTPGPTGPPEFLTITIDAVAAIGGAESETTCPAQVSLMFVTSGGDPTTMLGRASLYAQCTDTQYAAIDASGTFDGHTFALTEGRYTYTGSFDGSTATITGGPNDETFVFTVPAPPTPTPTPAPTASPSMPATEPLGVTRDVSGDVYISPADEADLQPADRHWRLIKPGGRILLEEGAMLRTGKDGGVVVTFSTGALTRLGPSTLFGMKKFQTAQTSQWVMYGRLWDGIAWFYMQKWKESGKKFEVETERAIVGIKGTTWEMSVTPAATVVTVAEGVVTLTDKATGTTIDVGPSERATVDGSGMTKTAAPDAAALLDENAPPGMSLPTNGAAGTAGPFPASSPGAGAAATAAPSGSGSDSGGSSLPLVLGVVAVVVVAALVAVALVRRSRAGASGPSGPSGPAGPSGGA